jgi:hypothetical protein
MVDVTVGQTETRKVAKLVYEMVEMMADETAG